MTDPIPITQAELPKLIMELTMAGAKEVLVEEADGVQYLTASTHPGQRWFVVDPEADLVFEGLEGPNAIGKTAPEASTASKEQLVVDLHFPLTPTAGLAQDQFPFPWIFTVQDRLSALTLASDGAEDYDDAEEFGETYAFFLTGEDEEVVLSAAKRIAAGPGLPTGAFAIINSSGADMGQGDRIDFEATA